MASMLNSVLVPRRVPPEAIVSALVVLGFATFLVTGFNAFHLSGTLQPVPLYAYLGLLLVYLQLLIAQDARPGHVAYVLSAGVFALVYAGLFAFSDVDLLPGLLRNPAFYLVLNVVLLALFVYGASTQPQGGSADGAIKDDGGAGAPSEAAAERGPARPARPRSPFSVVLAADAAGLGIVSGLMSGSLWLLEDARDRVAPLLRALHLLSPDVILYNIPVDVPILGRQYHLWQLDLGLALVGFAGSFVSLVIVGFLVALGQFALQFREIMRAAGGQVSRSLRLVLTPFVWLIPTSSIAAFATFATGSLAHNATSFRSGGNPPDVRAMLDLVNPFYDGLSGYDVVGADLALAAVALSFLVLTVAFAEQNGAVIRETLVVIGDALTRGARTLVFFVAGLAVANALPMVFVADVPEPFRVGPTGLVALVFLLISFGVQAAQRGRDRRDVGA